MSVEWDSGRRVLLAPIKIVSGANRIHAARPPRAPNDTHGLAGSLSGGTIVLAGVDKNRAAADLQTVSTSASGSTPRRSGCC